MSHSTLLEWVRSQLSGLLGFPDDGQLAQHLLTFDSKQALHEFTSEMFGRNKAIEQFTNEVWRRKTGEKTAPSTTKPTKKVDDLYATTTNTNLQAIKQKENAAAAAATAASSQAAFTQPTKSVDPSLEFGRNVKVKVQKSKPANGASSSGGPVHRVACHCQASIHPLFTNCTVCGKIICEAEGEGLCLFCGSMVTQAGTFPSEEFTAFMKSMESKEIVEMQKELEKKEKEKSGKSKSTDGDSSSASTTDSSSSDYSKAAETEAAGLAKAEAQRNKLLSFAHDKKKSSQIFDAQNDWYEFESNSWLSKEAREQKKKETEQALLNLERRRDHTVTIDLVNRQVIHHSSDAWEESLQPQEHQPKWTDPEPDVANVNGSGISHGESMAQAMYGSKQLQKSVEEMKVVSKYQYFHNDTLTGRAKEVYQSLKQSLRASSASSSTSAASSAASIVKPANQPAAENPLLDSLKKNIGKAMNARSYRGDDDGGDGEDHAMSGLSDGMSELSCEERLAASRSSTASCFASRAGTGGDDDEPTNCSGALDSSSSNSDSIYTDASDRGMCLSMHQPWASLLVLGIKRFEGRGWYTPYRGRLWIASGSHEPTPEEIASVEEECRLAYGPHAKIPFPQSYPTSALLGCVDLTHCWTSDEFQAWRNNRGAIGEDSQSAFVFVCTHPRILPLPQSHSGQHKIYSLPPKLYQALGPTLKPVNEKWRLTLPEFKASAEESGFDIWPAGKRPTPLANALPSVKPNVTVLQPGMLLLKQALPLKVQQSLIDCVRHMGVLGGDTGFVTPTYKDGPSMNLKMMCLGFKWNVNTNKYDRMNELGKKMQLIPNELLEQVDKMLTIGVEYLQARGAGQGFPHYIPDIAIVNYYSASSGKLGIHQDKSESSHSIKAGYPVISFSIGDSAEFVYGDKRIPDHKLGFGPGQEQYNHVTLASGDVLLFGGPSRSIFHGVDRIIPNSKPRDLWMKQGRVNITFRKL